MRSRTDLCEKQVPTEQEEAFRNFVIVLRPEASMEEINAIVYRAMMDPEELQMKALAAFAYAREHLTNTRKVDRMLSDVELYRRVSLVRDDGWSLPPWKAYADSLACSRPAGTTRLQREPLIGLPSLHPCSSTVS